MKGGITAGRLVDRTTRKTLENGTIFPGSSLRSAEAAEEGPGPSIAVQMHERQKTLNLALLPAEHSEPYSSSVHRASWGATVATLLSLQLGWGLWLMPHDFARLGWIPASVSILGLTVLSVYSGALISRLSRAAGGAMHFGDIGEAAGGAKGRYFINGIVCTMDATRCIIVHLAATQSLQHTISDPSIPLWYYGIVIGVIAVILVQIKSLSEMGWFLTIGTGSQIVALVILIYKVLADPHPMAETVLVNSEDWPAAAVAIMNVVYAFSGQSAYVEIIAEMKGPHRFPSALSSATCVMVVAYFGIGIAGYVSQGATVDGIIIFDMGHGGLARLASGAVLIQVCMQAVAQYLVTLNIWSHNILLLLARRKAAKAGIPCQVHYANDHHWIVWLVTTCVIISYAFAISISIPFFSTLVGLIASGTYLTTAYTIPAMCTLAIMGKRLHPLEYYLCCALVPLSIVGSCTGMYSSVLALMEDLAVPALSSGPLAAAILKPS